MADNFPELMEEMCFSDLGSIDLGSPKPNKQIYSCLDKSYWNFRIAKTEKNLKSGQKEMTVTSRSDN